MITCRIRRMDGILFSIRWYQLEAAWISGWQATLADKLKVGFSGLFEHQ